MGGQVANAAKKPKEDLVQIFEELFISKEFRDESAEAEKAAEKAAAEKAAAEKVASDLSLTPALAVSYPLGRRRDLRLCLACWPSVGLIGGTLKILPSPQLMLSPSFIGWVLLRLVAHIVRMWARKRRMCCGRRRLLRPRRPTRAPRYRRSQRISARRAMLPPTRCADRLYVHCMLQQRRSCLNMLCHCAPFSPCADAVQAHDAMRMPTVGYHLTT